MVDSKNSEQEMIKYADDLAKKVLSYGKTKKFHLTFLKNINDLIAATLDQKQIDQLEKEISNMYNNKLKEGHKKKKDDKPKINMSNKYDDELDEDYIDEDDFGGDYKNFA